MKNYLLIFIIAYLAPHLSTAQNTSHNITIRVIDENQKFIENASIKIFRNEGTQPTQTLITNVNGSANFSSSETGKYWVEVTALNFKNSEKSYFEFPTETKFLNVFIQSKTTEINEVSFVSKKQLIQRSQGKTLINVDANITNTGISVLEVLEKSPGVSIDKNGAITLQGKPKVLVLIDDKPTYISGPELNNLLSSMNSAQVNQIELITTPSAKYDASGNAGIINIKTKKNNQDGINGNMTINYGQGIYHKNSNALNLNYKKGKFNNYLNYNLGFNKNFTDLYAYRTYFTNTGSVKAILDQDAYLTNSNKQNVLKIGTDYLVNEKTTIGASFNGALRSMKGAGENYANWLRPNGNLDSTLLTNSGNNYELNHFGIQLYGSHQINKNQKISADFDRLGYEIKDRQNFDNQVTGAATSILSSNAGKINSNLNIYAAKVDYVANLNDQTKFEAGYKTSTTKTDNKAAYTLLDGKNWVPDYNKSNHFLYNEFINSAYSSVEYKKEKLSAQLGLRYENTYYKGHQKGNALRADSTFSRAYNDLFPSTYISYQIDSVSSLSINAGKRIDRPAYQKLNPFVYIVNKYTHIQGNPFFLPQHSWNIDLTHSWKGILITSLSFSDTKNYFSQLFFEKEDDILAYAEGNVGKMYNYGISVSAQLPINKWWSFTGQSVFNHKELKGYRGLDYSSTINQLHTNINNSFRINKDVYLEVSGFYTSKARNDLQEVLRPTGQVSLGLAKTILKGKGTFKLSARDVFYTQAMEGDTDFPTAHEYFKIKKDSRSINFGFSYNFGKKLKSVSRSGGSASDEMKRAAG